MSPGFCEVVFGLFGGGAGEASEINRIGRGTERIFNDDARIGAEGVNDLRSCSGFELVVGVKVREAIAVGWEDERIEVVVVEGEVLKAIEYLLGSSDRIGYAHAQRETRAD